MWSKIILISLLSLSLEAGIISKTIKKVAVDKTKDIIVDKTKDKAKTTVKKKIDGTLTKIETGLNKKLENKIKEQKIKRSFNGK